MSYFRPNVEAMSGYVPGEQPQGGGFVKLNTNENPYPPSPRVVEALRKWIGPKLRLYPDPNATAVRERVGRLFDVSPDRVIVGNGSDDILTIVYRSFVEPGEVVAYPTPTYSLYPTLARIQGARVREVPFPEDFSLPCELSETGTKLTLLSNPNSPTGTVVPSDEVSRLAESLDGILVVDEAYVDFAESHCVDLVKRHDNVVVTRSFSKSFALCGLRLGYAVADETLVAGMLKVKDSYNVNRLAAVAGAAALDDIEYMRENAERIKRTRARLAAELERLEWQVRPSQANFVFARVTGSRPAKHVYEELKQRKILVRHFGDSLRITVGTDEEIDTLIESLRDVLTAGWGSPEGETVHG